MEIEKIMSDFNATRCGLEVWPREEEPPSWAQLQIPAGLTSATCASVVALQTLSDTPTFALSQRHWSRSNVAQRKIQMWATCGLSSHYCQGCDGSRNNTKLHSSIRENLLNPGSIDVDQ